MGERAGESPADPDRADREDARIWDLTSTAGDLDISFKPSGTTGYDDLVGHAETLHLWGIEIRVAALDDIIRSKRAADRPKDRAVLPMLERLRDELA